MIHTGSWLVTQPAEILRPIENAVCWRLARWMSSILALNSNRSTCKTNNPLFRTPPPSYLSSLQVKYDKKKRKRSTRKSVASCDRKRAATDKSSSVWMRSFRAAPISSSSAHMTRSFSSSGQQLTWHTTRLQVGWWMISSGSSAQMRQLTVQSADFLISTMTKVRLRKAPNMIYFREEVKDTLDLQRAKTTLEFVGVFLTPRKESWLKVVFWSAAGQYFLLFLIFPT